MSTLSKCWILHFQLAWWVTFHPSVEVLYRLCHSCINSTSIRSQGICGCSISALSKQSCHCAIWYHTAQDSCAVAACMLAHCMPDRSFQCYLGSWVLLERACHLKCSRCEPCQNTGGNASSRQENISILCWINTTNSSLLWFSIYV